MLIVYTDGCCLGNPGPMGIGVAIYEDGKLIAEISEYAGLGTNNVAEYLAVIRALSEIKKRGKSKAILRTDSQLLANQLNGIYKVKDKKLKKLKAEVDKLLSSLSVVVEHIPREQNTLADMLSKKGAESRK